MGCKLSLVIPAKDVNDPKLAELLSSIDRQDFPKDELEILVITEGTSESAKAIGIKRAKGEIIGILASDNELTFPTFLSEMTKNLRVLDASWPMYYTYFKHDDILNRYFALIGGNDVLSFYMGKNDKEPFLKRDNLLEDFSPMERHPGTIGDNGFFIKKELIERTDLDNYYHIDNALEALAGKDATSVQCDIWHKTGGNLLPFFTKRYRYGLQHAFNPNRRWHLVDFYNRKDILRLLWFIFCSVTLIEPLILSLRGYSKIKDVAWFMHPLVCLMTLSTYACLTVHLSTRSMYRWLFAPMAEQRA